MSRIFKGYLLMQFFKYFFENHSFSAKLIRVLIPFGLPRFHFWEVKFPFGFRQGICLKNRRGPISDPFMRFMVAFASSSKISKVVCVIRTLMTS